MIVLGDNNLSKIMKDKGLTIIDLSLESGVPWRTIELYHQGRRDLGQARARAVLDLADALGVHPRDLLEP